ncbi:MAG TPA: permease-like cell division protein FtsX [Actinomycetota bacterium]|nr:permease-like cell division protein FtsX [Actinomycetota bacterium]
MRIGYLLAETATNLKRNLLMSVAAVSTVTISLLLLGGVLLLGLVVENMTRSWEAKVEVSIFLLDDATEGEVQELTQTLTDMNEVTNVDYVSKAEAFEEFKEQWADQPEFWQNLPEDALPASLRVKLTDAKYAEAVATVMEGAPGVDDVRFGGEIIRRLLQVNSLLRTITFVMSLVLLIASAALIANTIRVAIYARRDEIGIMKLVGATNWFIRVPFMMEGVFAALVGALIAGSIVLLSDLLLFSRMGEALPFLANVVSFSSSEIAWVLGILAGVGALVGLVGSSMALRRFLEV